MPDLFDSFISTIEKKKEQLQGVIDAYRAFRQKLDELPQELAQEAMRILGGSEANSSPKVVADVQIAPKETDSSFTGVPALRCTRTILTENGNNPLHYSEVARRAMARGYKGRLAGSKEEVESRTIQSFWAAMSRSEDFEAVGSGRYRIRQQQEVSRNGSRDQGRQHVVID
jgi:hypothetical protein